MLTGDMLGKAVVQASESTSGQIPSVTVPWDQRHQLLLDHLHLLRDKWDQTLDCDDMLDSNALWDALCAIFYDCDEWIKRQATDACGSASDFVTKYQTTVNYLNTLRLNKNDFEILKPLAEGQFGQVSIVRSKLNNEIYAMKTLNKANIVRQKEQAFYMEERNVLFNGKSSPWIPSLYASFQDSDNLYLVMEYAAGGDLFSVLDRKEDVVLDESDARFYIAEIILAIWDLHEMNFVHRDLKPQNILIDKDGHIKLADFGSCIQLDSAGEVHSEIPVGTCDYISPEVLKAMEGKVAYGKEVDWWSLGVLLYELLTGETPFESISTIETYAKIMDFKKYLSFPEEPELSQNAKDLIQRLICDKESRLGRQGIEEIMEHPFFDGLDFKNVRQQTPPFLPVINSPDDTSNFSVPDDDEPRITPPDRQGYYSRRDFYGNNLLFIGYTKLCDEQLRKVATETLGNANQQVANNERSITMIENALEAERARSDEVEARNAGLVKQIEWLKQEMEIFELERDLLSQQHENASSEPETSISDEDRLRLLNEQERIITEQKAEIALLIQKSEEQERQILTLSSQSGQLNSSEDHEQEERVQQLMSDLQTLKAEKESMAQSLTSSHDDKREAEDRLNSLYMDLDYLVEALNESDMELAATTFKSEALQSLWQKLSESSRKHAQVAMELESLRQDSSSLRTHLDQLRSECEILRKANQRSDEQIADLRESERKLTDAKTVEGPSAQIVEQQKSQISDLKNLVQDLSAQLNKERLSFAQAGKKLEMTSARLTEVESSYDALQERCLVLEKERLEAQQTNHAMQHQEEGILQEQQNIGKAILPGMFKRERANNKHLLYEMERKDDEISQLRRSLEILDPRLVGNLSGFVGHRASSRLIKQLTPTPTSSMSLKLKSRESASYEERDLQYDPDNKELADWMQFAYEPRANANIRQIFTRKFVKVINEELFVLESENDSNLTNDKLLFSLKSHVLRIRAVTKNEFLHMPNKDLECLFQVQKARNITTAGIQRVSHETNEKVQVEEENLDVLLEHIRRVEAAIATEDKLRVGAERFMAQYKGKKHDGYYSARQQHDISTNVIVQKTSELATLRDTLSNLQSRSTSAHRGHGIQHDGRNSTRLNGLLTAEQLERVTYLRQQIDIHTKGLAAAERTKDAAGRLSGKRNDVWMREIDNSIRSHRKYLQGLQEELDHLQQQNLKNAALTNLSRSSTTTSLQRDTISSKGHIFHPAGSASLQVCQQCHDGIWGSTSSALQCIECRAIVHRHCANIFDLTCEEQKHLENAEIFYFIAETPDARQRWIYLLNQMRRSANTNCNTLPTAPKELALPPPINPSNQANLPKADIEVPKMHHQLVTDRQQHPRPLPALPSTGHVTSSNDHHKLEHTHSRFLTEHINHMSRRSQNLTPSSSVSSFRSVMRAPLQSGRKIGPETSQSTDSLAALRLSTGSGYLHRKPVPSVSSYK